MDHLLRESRNEKMTDTSQRNNHPTEREASLGYRKSLSNSILSKFYLLRASGDDMNSSTENNPTNSDTTNERAFSKKSTRAMAVAVEQKTRRRKGSLRKAALLGRGALRERKESRPFSFENKIESANNMMGLRSPISSEDEPSFPNLGLGISDIATRKESSSGDYNTLASSVTTLPMGKTDQPLSLPTSKMSPTLSYTSTDEEDMSGSLAHNTALRYSSDSYFPPSAASVSHHRSVQKAKSPLSAVGLPSNPLPASDVEWDYSETEWWGWALLILTWIVFVIGMGSCLGVWSWAWDVGETPYAPPELEDDPTLPIVGYYPALIILTSVMAWVWVIVAWVGMKYFRHTNISGE